MMNKSIMLFCALFVSLGCSAANPFEAMCLNGESLKLYQAVEAGDLDAVKAGVKQLGVGRVDGTGTTPLMVAARTNQYEIAQYLVLQKGIEINAVNGAGWTSLHYAAAWGNKDMVILLLQHGADKTVTNALEQTPEQTARQREHIEIAKKIASYSRTKSAAKTE